MARETVVVATARTPFGRLGGGLATVPAVALGAHAIEATISRAGIEPALVEYVLMGTVVTAGQGQIPARQAAMAAGIPKEVPADTVNKVCASSLRAVNLADALIRAGDLDVVVAGGMESMSQAPYLVPKGRFGYRYGNAELVDALYRDGLECPWAHVAMGVYGSDVAAEFGVSRAEQDAWAYRSHMRAVAARRRRFFEAEMVPFPRQGGEPLSEDESVRPDTTLEQLARLKPAFKPDGTTTAGNSPGLTDGGAALLLMSSERAKALGLTPLARIVAQGQASREPKYLHTVPALAAEAALRKAGRTARDLRRVEINEAFAAVAIVSTRLLGVDEEIVNVNGGAVAIGHPLGATGARILMTLIHALREAGGGLGVAALCSGGGQGEATLVEVA
jgi:acetyl-CoA C-acetyltransferase